LGKRYWTALKVESRPDGVEKLGHGVSAVRVHTLLQHMF
jgi:hypothetical protein